MEKTARISHLWRLATRASLPIAVLACSSLALADEPPSPPPTPPGAPAAADPEITTLRRELDLLRARTEAAERAAAHATQRLEAESKERQRQRDADAARLDKLQQDAATSVKSSLGVRLSGLVQADAVLWRQSSTDELDPSTGEPLNETRFLLRRARLRAELDYRFVFGAFELDANTVRGPQVRPIAFEAGARWRAKDSALPYLAASLGLVRTPFGLEVQQSDRERLFFERSHVATAFFPGEYDLGLRVFGGWRFLRYQLAVMNGNPIGDRVFPARDPNSMKDIVGRVGLDTRLTSRVHLEAGVSAIWGRGFHKGVAASKDVLVWRDANENGIVDTGELQTITGQTGQPSQSFDRYAVGADLRLGVTLPRLGDLVVYGELGWGTNMDRVFLPADPIAQGRDLRELGLVLGVTQDLTRYGQLGVRCDWYNADRDATRLRNAQVVPRTPVYSTIAVTAAARLPGYGRLVLEYQHNTNPLGRDKSGAPTTLPDDSLQLRAEVTF